MRTTFLLGTLFFSCIFSAIAKNDSITEPTALIDTVQAYYFPESEYEFIPGEANFDLIKDRLSCIENIVPLHYNNNVHAFVNYFAVKDRDYTRLMIKRKNLYFPLFEKYLKKYGIPEELKYLSIVESGLNPTAVSRAQAVGLWQFMSYTGRHFGLHQDWYIDERMDPEKSTEAACRYLKQLYNMFGDWELAIAAYNTGPGNIRRAIRRSGGKRTFWEIYPYIHRETRAYLPQFIAIAYIMNYSQEHNFLEENLEYQMEVDTIFVSDYLHVQTFANQVNLCLDDLQKLNPALKRNVIPETKNGYPLKVPADIKEYFAPNRVAILDSASKVGKAEIEYLAKNTPGSTLGRDKITYKVRSGDVLGTIAQRHNVSVSDLKAWNNLRSNTIRIGQTLNIWQNPGTRVAQNNTPSVITSSDGSKMYVVQPGDTLWDISRKFANLSLDELKRINQLQSNNIKPGQKLIVSR
ncbi:Membrane-bound lytic murein transglycosylase D precursor [Fulvivirga imtechensis AK7]|uniref:Membrane-bound lytic murein transglycosylase D n=1 Tax=Fulvivirga imtechensis AK7 TaxID=1237149 RepID=L8JLB6_9BACT|nr:lytic transglycosylase domain-containing protein [Fulvivirga imtechensis]ELR69731.1 Membrane-bound lytic murein transglycosylase D precursor [Fulvivirga imtechensis AK7]